MPPFATLRSTVRHRRAAINQQLETHHDLDHPQACDLRFGFEITMYIAAK
jgi:coenzyme PQQ precursor peptide PqqA